MATSVTLDSDWHSAPLDQMEVVLQESIAARGRFDVAYIAPRYRQWQIYMHGLRNSYSAVATPALASSGCSAAILLADCVMRVDDCFADEKLVPPDKRNCRQFGVQALYAGLSLSLFIWIAYPAAALPRAHDRFLATLAMACALPADTLVGREARALTPSALLAKDKAGVRVAGQLVTRSFLVKSLTYSTTIYTLFQQFVRAELRFGLE